MQSRIERHPSGRVEYMKGRNMHSKDDVGKFSMNLTVNQTPTDNRFQEELGDYFHSSLGDTIDKLRNFPKFVPNPVIGKFLARYEIFKQVLGVHGSIVECGVHLGGGLMTWAQFSTSFEPFNHPRKIIGFDTFEGFVGVTDVDHAKGVEGFSDGTLDVPAYEDLQKCARIHDLGRPISHIPKIELVKGNAIETIPAYIAENRHLMVALLYLDFDLYEPTKVAIEKFRPRMPKGAIIAFDELNLRQWPGETVAVLDTLGISNLRIQRFPHQAQMSFAVLD
jgi:hypothetical protein